jgi:hypothetical protein
MSLSRTELRVEDRLEEERVGVGASFHRRSVPFIGKRALTLTLSRITGRGGQESNTAKSDRASRIPYRIVSALPDSTDESIVRYIEV